MLAAGLHEPFRKVCHLCAPCALAKAAAPGTRSALCSCTPPDLLLKLRLVRVTGGLRCRDGAEQMGEHHSGPQTALVEFHEAQARRVPPPMQL